MRENRYIRQAKLLILEREYGKLSILADATGTNAGYLSQVKNGTRAMGNKVARKLEAGAQLKSGWMDVEDNDLGDGTEKPINVNPLSPIEKRLVLFFRALEPERRDRVVDYIALASSDTQADKRILRSTTTSATVQEVAPTKDRHEKLATVYHDLHEKYAQRHGLPEIDSEPDHPRLPAKRPKTPKRGTAKTVSKVSAKTTKRRVGSI